jgi:hypothetical protein
MFARKQLENARCHRFPLSFRICLHGLLFGVIISVVMAGRDFVLEISGKRCNEKQAFGFVFDGCERKFVRMF